MKDLADDDVQIDHFFDEFRTDFPKLQSTINDIKNLTFTIQRDFTALSKIGWNLVPSAGNQFSQMNKSTYNLLKRYNSILRLIERYNASYTNGDFIRSTKAKQKLNKS